MLGPDDVPRGTVLRAADAVGHVLKDVADVPVELMITADKREALLAVTAVQAQVESLRLRLVASAGEVADELPAVTSLPGCRAGPASTAPRPPHPRLAGRSAAATPISPAPAPCARPTTPGSVVPGRA